MIQPQDLRIGNKLLYLTAENDWIMIDWQGQKWCEEDNKGFNAVHKPIPIAPDVLGRSGFSNIELNEYTIVIYNDKEGVEYSIINECFHVESIYICQLKGFHHLQNIIYDLTGIELTL